MASSLRVQDSLSLQGCCRDRSLRSNSRPRVATAARRGKRNNNPVFAPSAQYSPSSASGAPSSSSGSSGSSSSNAGAEARPPPPRAEDLVKRAQEAFELLQEIVEIAVSTGPSGISRSLVAAQACASLGARVLRDPNNPPKPQELLRQLFEALGATYIKLGQFIASSPTLFPEEYVEEFQKCFDRAPAVPYATIRDIIAAELGKPVDAVFESVDPVPLASASVAQVHAAVLRGSRKDVVVKVLKPDVTDTLAADLSFIYIASRVLTFLNPELARLSLTEIVGDIRSSMMEEVDFKREASNIMAFQNYLEAAGITGAIAPYVYSEASSTKVLTLERLYGSPLTDLEAIAAVTSRSASGGRGGDPEQILITALNTWFGSVLACESFHADVHAGNLLVLRDGRVGFIDFGIVGRVSPGVWGAVQIFFQATASRDYDLMAKSLVQMGAAEADVDTAKFADDLRQIYESLDKLEPEVMLTETADGNSVAAAVAVDQQEISRLLIDIVRVGDRNGVKFPREFGLLLKQVLYFDRYVRLLAPEMEVVSDERVAFMDSAATLSPNAAGVIDVDSFRTGNGRGSRFA